jgi:hypothetical protein
LIFFLFSNRNFPLDPKITFVCVICVDKKRSPIIRRRPPITLDVRPHFRLSLLIDKHYSSLAITMGNLCRYVLRSSIVESEDAGRSSDVGTQSSNGDGPAPTILPAPSQDSRAVCLECPHQSIDLPKLSIDDQAIADYERQMLRFQNQLKLSSYICKTFVTP